MNNDHAPRLRAQQLRREAENAAIDDMEKRAAPLFWIVMIAASIVLIWLRAYDTGRQSMQRVCPEAQQGERLLSSEQQPGKTVCHYAEGEAGYGHVIKHREVKS